MQLEMSSDVDTAAIPSGHGCLTERAGGWSAIAAIEAVSLYFGNVADC
jgi:hypothetical protein